MRVYTLRLSPKSTGSVMPKDYRLFGRLAGDSDARDVHVLGHTAPVRDAANLGSGLSGDGDVVGRTLRQRARQHEFAVRCDRQLRAVALQLQSRAVEARYRAADTQAEV